MKPGMDEVLKVPDMFEGILTRSAQGWVQCGAKIGNGEPLFQKTSSDRKTTATNPLRSNDLGACGKKCRYYLLQSDFLMRC